MRNAYRFILMLTCSLALAAPAAAGVFRATLSDAENVPPFMSPTQAEGGLKLKSSRRKLQYELTVSNLQNAFAAHIHCAEAGVAGPVGVTLFQGTPGAAFTLNGTIAHGRILGPDRVNGCGWVNLRDVISALKSGDTYVNIHTLQSFPGEIRGQIR